MTQQPENPSPHRYEIVDITGKFVMRKCKDCQWQPYQVWRQGHIWQFTETEEQARQFIREHR